MWDFARNPLPASGKFWQAFPSQPPRRVTGSATSDDLSPDERRELFVQRLTGNQGAIYGYIYSLLGHHSRAADVLQETNLVLWRKVDEYDAARPFKPWAFAIARFQVLAALRDAGRDRLLLTPELVEQFAGEGGPVSAAASRLDRSRDALRNCLARLAEPQRDLVERRYFRGQPMADIAAATDRTAGAAKVALLRVRRKLAECIRRQVGIAE